MSLYVNYMDFLYLLKWTQAKSWKGDSKMCRIWWQVRLFMLFRDIICRLYCKRVFFSKLYIKLRLLECFTLKNTTSDLKTACKFNFACQFFVINCTIYYQFLSSNCFYTILSLSVCFQDISLPGSLKCLRCGSELISGLIQMIRCSSWN